MSRNLIACSTRKFVIILLIELQTLRKCKSDRGAQEDMNPSNHVLAYIEA